MVGFISSLPVDIYEASTFTIKRNAVSATYRDSLIFFTAIFGLWDFHSCNRYTNMFIMFNTHNFKKPSKKGKSISIKPCWKLESALHINSKASTNFKLADRNM